MQLLTRRPMHEEVVSVIDPSLWSTLPKELLRLVYAHLPLPQLLYLRRSALDNSQFRRLCARFHSNLCAVIVRGAECGHYNLGVHNAKSSSWQTLKINVDGPYKTMDGSSAGGLVCFALALWSSVNDGPSLVILAVNPLTGDCRELPGHGVRPIRLRMMQLAMDRNTKRYQMLLVASKFDSVGGVGARLYDSGTGVWTNTTNSSDLFLGLQHHFENSMDIWPGRDVNGPWAFDCATGKLLFLDEIESNPYFDKRSFSGDFAFVKNRLFVLDMSKDEDGVPMYSISEHQIQVQENELSWTKLKDRRPSRKIPVSVSASLCLQWFSASSWNLQTN